MSQKDISNPSPPSPSPPPPPPPPVPSKRPLQMSQEIQSDPGSNHSDEHESQIRAQVLQEIRSYYKHVSQAVSNPVSLNQPLRDLIDISNRENYLKIGLPLYKASMKCDWKAAKAILDTNPNINLLRCSINENRETALHIAASAKAPNKKADEFVRNQVERMENEDLELVNNNQSTGLHIVASAKGPKKKVDEFVRNLVMRMEPEDLELVNNNKSTALYLAASAGNIETVKIMMKKNPTLDTIPGGGGDMMPLYAAVLFGNEDVARYLYESSKSLANDVWTRRRRTSLLEKCVESDMFDIALEIVKKYPELGKRSNSLGLLARKPKAFREKKSSNAGSNIIRRTIKPVSAFFGNKETPVKKGDALSLLTILCEDIVKLPKMSIENILKGPPDSIKSDIGRIHQTTQLKELIFNRLDKLREAAMEIITEKGTLTVPKLKDLVSEYAVDMHFETQNLIKKKNTTEEDQFLELISEYNQYIVKLHDETVKLRPAYRLADKEDLAQRLLGLIDNHITKMRAETKIRATYSSRVMFIAAEVGNTKFLVELIRRRPDLIWQVDDNGLSIFHVAVKHRHEGIYNLLYEIGSMKDMVTPLTDKDGNNMLHLAAMRTRKKNLEDVSGAALQMQRELLWFKEVERMVPPSSRVSKNKDGFTPRELFTMEHQHLIDHGEKWMKETASQCMVVAALIATIVFAAAFTVPGGYDQNDGIPMFKQKLSFVAFVVADAISLFLSSASILTFLSILTSRYAECDFVAKLPMKLMLGLVTLFLSIVTMMVTFSVSFFVLYHKEMKWIPIFISGFAVIPAILYVVLQFHLLVDVFRSTYGGKYLFKPENQVLFYENPNV